MHTRHLLYVVALICLFLSGCHNSGNTDATSGKTTFKDERSMRAAMMGSWILQEYTDSIDAGLTPKLLEFMLEKQRLIEYDPNKKEGTADPVHSVYISEGNSNDEQLMLADFKFADNKIIFRKQAGDTSGKAIGQVVNADVIINAPDTILRLYTDSLLSSYIDFVKYDNSKCPDIDVYHHLINSKFIAGKYFREDDRGKERHIIFTRCGNIEGAENIDPSLHGHTDYDISMSHFLTSPDAIELYDPVLKMGRTFYWEVSEDSLILRPNKSDKGTSIVLIKAL